jgi:methylisocitrate lyase
MIVVISVTAQESVISKWKSGAKLSDSNKRIVMKYLMSVDQHIMVPGVFDAISARLAEQVGFPVIYCGSYATAASEFGLPDTYMVTWTEMAANVRKVVNATNIPVIADGENGWGYATNMWRVVQALEQAGAAGIHIEDGEFGKHTDLPKTYQPLDLMVGKIKAAVDAREDPNFLIIARVDVTDMEDSVARSNAYLAAGADIVFPTGAWPKSSGLVAMKAFRDRIKGKVLTMGTGFSSTEEEYIGINIVLHYDYTIQAAYPAMKVALERLLKTDDINKTADLRSTAGFTDFIGTPAFIEDFNLFMKPYMKK